MASNTNGGSSQHQTQGGNASYVLLLFTFALTITKAAWHLGFFDLEYLL